MAGKYQVANIETGKVIQEKRSCVARGCPRIASIFTDGQWICRYHDGKAAKDWPTITNWLHDNESDVNRTEREKGYVIPVFKSKDQNECN